MLESIPVASAQPRSMCPDTVAGLSKPVSAWKVFRATVVKDLQIERRYVPDLVGKAIELGVRVLFFLLLSNILSFKASSSALGHHMTGRSLFIFFQGALLLYVFTGTALSTPIDSVSRDLYNGTLEYLYSNPISRYSYFVGTVVANAIIRQIVFLPLYLFLVIYSQANPINMVLILVVCVTVLVTLVALGILVALLGMLWRQVGSASQVVSIAFEMLSGAYFPISAFPAAVLGVSFVLPFTWGYDLIRYYSFDGRWGTLLPVWLEWGVLVLEAAVFTLVSRSLLRRAEARAKRSGLHII